MSEGSLCEQAAALIPDIIAKQPAELLSFVSQHATDTASYSFSCKRHGDWLAVFLERGSKKEAHTINLLSCPSIFVESGREPDMKGRISFTATYMSNSKQRGVAAYLRPDCGYSPFHVKENEAYPRTTTIYIQPPPSPSREGIMMARGWAGEDQLRGLHVPDCAQPAQDDMVIFSNIGVALFMPFGVGQTVYQAILEELTVGAPKFDLEAFLKKTNGRD
jgi:hypothetical protein